MIKNRLNSNGKVLNDLCLKYENFVLIGDFNSSIHEDAVSVFFATYNLKNFVKEPICFKNAENPSCIDLILTNKLLYFQITKLIETGLSEIFIISLLLFVNKNLKYLITEIQNN